MSEAVLDREPGITSVSILEPTLEQMSDVPVTLVFEVARLDITIRQLLAMKEDSVLEIPTSCLDCINVSIDGNTIATGEITTNKERYGVRIEEFLHGADDGVDTP